MYNPIKIINTTPHPIKMQTKDGYLYELPPSGILINASIEFHSESLSNGVEFVQTRYSPYAESERNLAKLETENPGAIIVGSIIAAQAFPGRVFGLVSVPGFERVPSHEKRMLDHKFVTFADYR